MKKMNIKVLEKITLPKGFKAAGISAGLKKSGKPDMALIASDVPATVAGTFTTNQVKAATVKLCQKRLAGRTGQAVIVNSGNANACNGPQGIRDAEKMAALTAKLLGIEANYVFVSSTGRIGIRLPMDIIEAGIPKAAAALSPAGGDRAAEAIMTTDTRKKVCTIKINVDGNPVTITALCKGAGMIEPNMATMLAYVLTDANVNPKALQACLSDAVTHSFNRITVDGDRSTNDTVLFFANGQAGNRTLKPGHPAWPLFCEAVRSVTLNLALKIVQDGEGAGKFVTIRVRGAASDADADIAARSVANSLLVKTSWVGRHPYPNWGRVIDALGYSKARVVEERVDISYDNLPACRRGVYTGTPIEQLKKVVRQPRFTLDIHLNLGKGEAVVYTCDCTEEYVRINM